MLVDIQAITPHYQVKGSILKHTRNSLANTQSNDTMHMLPSDFISMLQWYEFRSLIELKSNLALHSGKCFTSITYDLAMEASANDHKYKVVHRMGGILKTLRKMEQVENERTNFSKFRTLTNENEHFSFEYHFPEDLTFWSLYFITGSLAGIMNLANISDYQYLVSTRVDYQWQRAPYTKAVIDLNYLPN